MFESLGTYDDTTPATALEYEGTGITLDEAEDYGGLQWAGTLPIVPVDLAAINGLTAAAAG